MQKADEEVATISAGFAKCHTFARQFPVAAERGPAEPTFNYYFIVEEQFSIQERPPHYSRMDVVFIEGRLPLACQLPDGGRDRAFPVVRYRNFKGNPVRTPG